MFYKYVTKKLAEHAFKLRYRSFHEDSAQLNRWIRSASLEVEITKFMTKESLRCLAWAWKADRLLQRAIALITLSIGILYAALFLICWGSSSARRLYQSYQNSITRGREKIASRQ